MGRVYSVFGENLTLSTGSVLIALQTTASPNAGCLIRPLRIEVTQSGSVTSAMVRLMFSTRNTVGTLTTTSVTPQNVALGGPASALVGNTSVIGGTGRIGINSSADAGGTYTDYWPNAPNQLNGYPLVYVPEERELILPSTVWCVRFAAAPASLTGWTIGFRYEEVV